MFFSFCALSDLNPLFSPSYLNPEFLLLLLCVPALKNPRPLHTHPQTQKRTQLSHTHSPPTDALGTLTLHQHTPFQVRVLLNFHFWMDACVALAVSSFFRTVILSCFQVFIFDAHTPLCTSYVTIKAFLTSQLSQEKIHQWAPWCACWWNFRSC